MQTYPLLPPLKDDGAGLAILPNKGTWQEVPAVALNNIAENLKVTKVDAKYTDIDSIPSMWARPLLFQIALYDTDHPMHDCIVGEWRGLLAMLALKERRSFPLTTKLIQIPSAEDDNTPEFLRALRKLMPEQTLDVNTTWDNLYLIMYGDKPIGITSPTTLVCTSIDYIKYISVLDVPWYDPPFLCDPIAYLNPEERETVAGWIDNFSTEKIVPLPDSELKTNLSARILDFIVKLVGVPAGTPEFAENAPLGMDQGIFSGMNYPIAPKEFFTKKLFVIHRPNAFLEKNTILPKGSTNLKIDGNPVTPILPITKELIEDFSVQELNQWITFEEIPSGIKVNLQLPSLGGQVNRISQEYVKKDGDGGIFNNYEIVEIPHLPVLEIWPNFRTPSWKIYYTYFNQAKQDTFYAEPFLSEGLSRSIEDMTITKTSVFPEMMKCMYKFPGSTENEEAGFLFVQAPPFVEPNKTKTWHIGIDFGTCSTTVYTHDPNDGSMPEPVLFSERLLQITDSRDLRTHVHDDFLSDRDESTPFFSLFQEHISSSSSQDGQIKPLLDGRIYFVEDYKLKENVVSNLKWSDEPIDRKRTRAYLRQICLQCAAEAAANNVNKVNWRFSYPIAFLPDDKVQFEVICKDITTDSMSDTGILFEPSSFESESIATAQYFARKYGGFAIGSICIDIGGETSDISIWQDTKLRWQTSIRFAGRHIFLDLLKHKPNFLDILGVDKKAIKVLTDASTSNNFYSQADTWLHTWINKSDQSLAKEFGKYGGIIKETPFVPLIALGISGLFYYVGLILNCLGDSNGFNRTMPNVYIGGNGSRALDWLANGNFGPNSANYTHLMQVILNASDFDQNSIFKLETTEHPKHEAAAGLVDVVLDSDADSTQKSFGILAGEDFTINGVDYEWRDFLTTEMFGSGLTLKKNPMQIENFISIFNEGIGNSLQNTIAIDRELKHLLISHLKDNLQKQSTAEPLFILGLKNLLKWKTSQWK